MSGPHHLQPSELHALDVAARVSASFSFLGASFVVISFLSYRPLRKPINRLAFCIAIANAITALGHFCARYGIKLGRESTLCQTQGFLLTWFVMTDPCLVLVMAFDVYLTVEKRRPMQEMTKLEAIGIFASFVLPCTLATVLLHLRPNGQTVYGDATLWCWISAESRLLRLTAFYTPIWIMILCSLALFGLTGKRIFLVRRQLKINEMEDRFLVDQGRLRRQTSRSTFMPKALSLPPSFRSGSAVSSPTLMTLHYDSIKNSPNFALPSYQEFPSVVSTSYQKFPSGISPSYQELPSVVSPSYQEFPSAVSSSYQEFHSTVSSPPPLKPVRETWSRVHPPMQRNPSVMATVASKYAKFAFLYALVLTITWLPISITRVWNAYIDSNHQIFGFYLASAICNALNGFGNFIIYTNTSRKECYAFIMRKGSDGDSLQVEGIQAKVRKRWRRVRGWGQQSTYRGRLGSAL